MKRLCVFIHYGKTTVLPYSVVRYIDELIPYFDEVALIYNERTLSMEPERWGPKVQWIPSPNVGYDFGHFYRYYKNLDVSNYEQIALVNDSNILVRPLQPVFAWSLENVPDFWGLIDSEEKPWFSTHENNHHLQSHFIVWNKKALSALGDFFSTLDIEAIQNETNPKKLRRLVIDQWEIGLSRFLFGRGLTGASFICSRAFLSRHHGKEKVNPAHVFFSELLDEGYPVLKKKILFKKPGFGSFRKEKKWESLLRKYMPSDWDPERTIDELKKEKP
ncbi:MAG TPA: rhamnan synthesis F family protein [Prolixibacteraceae bacterium]|nr:rhamnan synthesis F family protein [Prolixibacteraceae bacterium]